MPLGHLENGFLRLWQHRNIVNVGYNIQAGKDFVYKDNYKDNLANIPIGKMFYFHNTTRTFMRFNNLDFFSNLGGGAGDDFRRNYIPQFKGFTIMYVGEGRYASVSNL